MLFANLSNWMFGSISLASLALTTSTALAEPTRTDAQQQGSNIHEFEPLQAPPQLPQSVLDACRDHAAGEACSVEFQGQKLAGTCRKIPDHEELACLPAGPPPGQR